MKYGIALPNFGRDAQMGKILELSGAAEELGFNSLWVSDHVVIPGSHNGFGDEFLDPLTTLTYLAAKTNTISLGTSVLILPYRSPLVLAKAVSTLDELSGGRVILGIGAGWMKEEFSALGVPFEERGVITDEYIDVLKTLWTEDDPRHFGKYIEFSDIKFLPKPVQKPHPPIWVGGGSRRAIERAAERGEGWHPVGLTPAEIAERSWYLKEVIDKSEREPCDFTISVRKNLEITDKKDIAENETLRGTVKKIAGGIEEYEKAGVTHIIFHILSGEFKGVISTLELFSKELIV